VLAPGSTIGILGSGQLGRMLAIAAARLGLRTHIYADTSGPAFDVAAEHTIAPYGDLGHIRAFASKVDVVTYEFENVPLAAAAAAATAAPVRPGPRALEIAQDRIVEKRFLDGLSIPVAPFAEVNAQAELEAALSTIGPPAILKTCRYGYDGKGQVRISSDEQPGRAWDALKGQPSVLEKVVDFHCEISVLACRSIDGTMKFYDCPRNEHVDGILSRSVVPNGLPQAVCDGAMDIARTIAEELDYVGLLTAEMFVVSTGSGPDAAVGAQTAPRLLVNEIAPRVHNSGHWTMEACRTGQFENHIRAIAGWPLGDTSRFVDAQMINLIGDAVHDWKTLAADPKNAVHIYGKNEARPGRKMGHVTRLG